MGEPVDEDELENELEGLEQEQIDERMLKTGTVPVHDEINRLPNAANGERESISDNPTAYGAKQHASVKVKGTVHLEEEDEEAELAKLQAEMAM